MQQQPEPRIIIDPSEAEQLCEELMAQPLVSADSEWYRNVKKRHPVNNGLPLCWTFCWRDSHGSLQLVYLHNYGRFSTGNSFRLLPWWRSKDHVKIGHNAPVDNHIGNNEGLRIESFDVDTMVADFIMDENRENRHGLKECAEDHLGHVRKGFEETFGAPRLRKDGSPYASGELVVPKLDEFVDRWTEENPEEAVPPVLVDYATDDAYDTWLLYEFYKEKLTAVPWGKRTQWDYFMSVERKLTSIITRMERRGMYLDMEFLREQLLQCQEDIDSLQERIIEWAGVPFNTNSDQQLGHLLFGSGRKDIMKGKRRLFYIDGMALPSFKTTDGGAPSTDADSIKALIRWVKKDAPERVAGRTKDGVLRGLNLIAESNAIGTQKTTFLEGLYNKAINNRIHTRWNQIGASSGRGSSSGPNLQNITTGDKDRYHLRDVFCAPPGYVLVVADFGQLEYRLLAHFSQDPKLLAAFRDNLDLHSLTCYNIYPNVKAEVDERFGGPTKEALLWVADEFPDQRKRAKTLNFEIIYGVGYKKLAEQLNISHQEAKEMIDGWFRGYPYVKAWMNRELANFRLGHPGKTLIGRHRHAIMWRLMHKDYGTRGEEERTLINALVQGSAADVCERAMILTDEDELLNENGLQLLMQVHDELIWQCPIDNYKTVVPRIREIMENPFSKPLRVPLPVSIGVGPTWATAKH